MQTGSATCDRFGVASAATAEYRLAIYLAPGFSMLSLLSVIEPLRLANRSRGHALYRWDCLSLDGQPVTASNGLEQSASAAIDSAACFDIVVVCDAQEAAAASPATLLDWLRAQAAADALLIGLDGGNLALARAGLLSGDCAVERERWAEWLAEFPQLTPHDSAFVAGERVCTSLGGSAPLDLMLHLLRQQQGHALAAAVAEQFGSGVIRHQQPPRVLECIALMEANIEQPLTLCELAELLGTSKRQLERLFQRHLDSTPARYYLELRLRAARKMLEQRAMPVLEVSMACGFSSATHFGQRFRELFGVVPSEVRRGN